jgi:arsenate reductase (thioredoxin)
MTERPFNVLFLCTGNSARSILAEVLMNKWGAGQFHAFSAGSHPKGAVNPYSIKLLNKLGLPTEGLRSKSWDEFARPGAPPLDFVFTVCDNAAGEVCPIWPGQPISAHWGVEDPAAVEGSEEVKLAAFNKALQDLEARIRVFCSLSIRALDRAKIKHKLDEIGQARSGT